MTCSDVPPLRHDKVVRLMLRYSLTGVLLLATACVPLAGDREPSRETSIADDIHDSILTLDTHLDTPLLLVRPGFDITQIHDPRRDYSQVDLPRMRTGGLDGGFWAIYTPQGLPTEEAYASALERALDRSKAIRNLATAHPDAFSLAVNSKDAAVIAANGKRIVYQSIENAYPLGDDISHLQTFYELGVRMVGPVHSANNQFADSATSPDPKWNGLSPLGIELVKEANRLGMIVDASHASDAVFDQLLGLSKTPIILSHSGAKAVYDHPRNIDDERLLKLAASGGVVHVNSLGGYLRKLDTDPQYRADVGKAFREFMSLQQRTEADYEAFSAKRRAIDAKYSPERATFDDYMAHFLHILKLIGPDHVGVGADWDGGGGVIGMEDVASVGRITEVLIAEGYSKTEIEKIWSGNVLRLLRAAEDHKAGLR